jgi:23S rRNA pseudouridine1911/1915/1917 synthase
MRGRRLDQALAELVQDYSRSRLQQWIRSGQVTLDGRLPQARDKVMGGEIVRIDAEIVAQTANEAEPIPLDLIYEDRDILVLNKPAGLVVHPAAGNPAGTLLNALLHYDGSLAGLPRAGIVHRLDKNTSGLMVVARNLTAHKRLVEALQARTVKREYLTVVHSVLTAGGRIEAPIGRHPVDRKRMAVVANGKTRSVCTWLTSIFRCWGILSMAGDCVCQRVRMLPSERCCRASGGRPCMPRSWGCYTR